MTDIPEDPLDLLASVLGAVRRSGPTIWVTLLPIVDEPRTYPVDQAVLSLVSRFEQVVLDFTNVSHVDSDWLRLLKRLSVEGDQQGVRVGWHAVPEIVRKTADWLEIAAGLHFDTDETGD